MLKYSGPGNIKTVKDRQLIISNINRLVVHGKKDSSLFKKVCQEVRHLGDYGFVWIGLLNGDVPGMRKIDPIAFSGDDSFSKKNADDLLDETANKHQLLWQPAGSKRYRINRLDKNNSSLSPLLKKVIDRQGLASSMSIPLKYNNNTVGFLNIFSRLESSFNKEEINILLEISKKISTDTRGMKLEIELKNTLKQLQRALYETIDAITLMSEIKDPYTSGHQKKVALLASAISEEMGLAKHIIDGIYVSGLLHDVGKISVPNDILAKPGHLNEGEFIIVKNHPVVSYNILKNIEFPWSVADIVMQHHEKINGSGYPKGIRGNDICIEAKILAVADVVEAMTAHRPYRPALGLGKAVQEIRGNKNILYDKNIVEACIRAVDKKKVRF